MELGLYLCQIFKPSIMKYDLEERLIGYSVLILDIVDVLPENKGANHLGNQVVPIWYSSFTYVWTSTIR